MDSLVITQLHKRFKDKTVLCGLDLVVPQGSVFGFIGQNGAGKTTTMRLILGLIKADSGAITVCGEPVRYGDTTSNCFIGYLPDMPAYYDVMRPMEYLSVCGAVAGLSAGKTRERAGELLRLVGLSSERHRIGGFSRGMKQRLGIAQALLGEPSLLICDEPTSALDPSGRHDILMLLKGLKGKTTVLFSTHTLSDVERICDHMALLHQGKTALSGNLDEIRNQFSHGGYEIQFVSHQEAANFVALDRLRSSTLTTQVQDNVVFIQGAGGDDPGGFLLDTLSQSGLIPQRFALRERTLDDLYLEAVT